MSSQLSDNEFMSLTSLPEPSSPCLFDQLLEHSSIPLEPSQLQSITNRRQQCEKRVFYYFTEPTREDILKKYFQLTGITEEEEEYIGRVMRESERGLELPDAVKRKRTYDRSEHGDISSADITLRRQLTGQDQRQFKQVMKKLRAEKEEVKARRQMVEAMRQEENRKRFQQQQKLAEEIRNLKKSKLKQKLEYLRLTRAKKEAERKQSNIAYQNFIKDYHKVKPLHELKEEQFRMKIQQQTKAREDDIKVRIKTMLKPISVSQFEEHEKRYLEKRQQLEKEFENRRNSQAHKTLSPKKDYFRGKSHMFIEQQQRARLHSQHDQTTSLNRIRDYYENILKKMPKPKHTIQEIQQKSQKSVERLIALSKQRAKSLGNQYLKFNKERRKTEPQHKQPSISPIPAVIQTQPASPKNNAMHQSIDSSDPNMTKKKPYSNFMRIPRKLKPREIKDRYDVQDLIYENSKKDEYIRRTEEISKVKKKNPIAEQFAELESIYIDSIKEKLDILSRLY